MSTKLLFSPTGKRITHVTCSATIICPVEDVKIGDDESIAWQRVGPFIIQDEGPDTRMVDAAGVTWPLGRLRTTDQLSVIDEHSKVEYVADTLNIDEGQAQAVIDLVTDRLDPEIVDGVREWTRRCIHRPTGIGLVMYAIDRVTEGHGVEGVRSDDEGSHGADFEYVNQGDTYTMTVVFDHRTNQFLMTTMGDMIEQAEENDDD